MTWMGPPPAITRREMLIAGGAALLLSRAAGSATPTARPRVEAFDVEGFIDACVRASDGTASTQGAVQEVLARAMSNPAAVLAGVGEPVAGGLQALHRSPSLTILNIVWAPWMQLLPHDHNMWALIGIYTGREDNIFWERRQDQVTATGAAAVATGDVMALPTDVIHSVANPIGKLTGALHIYGGDFFAGGRTEWDPETLTGRPWSIQGAIRQFQESNDRYFGAKTGADCS